MRGLIAALDRACNSGALGSVKPRVKLSVEVNKIDIITDRGSDFLKNQKGKARAFAN